MRRLFEFKTETNRLRPAIAACLILLLLAILTLSVHAEDRAKFTPTSNTASVALAPFEVEGTIHYTSYDLKDGSERFVSQRFFKIVVDGCLWKIRTTNMLRGRPEFSLYVENATDGRDTYSTRCVDTWQTNTAPPPQRNPDIPFRHINTLLTVKTGNFPKMDGEWTAAIWLGYAARCYVNGLTNNCFRDIFSPSDRYANALVPFETVGTSNCIREILFYDEGYIGATDREGKPVYRSYPPPFDQGFVKQRFSVSEFYENENVRIPRKYTINYFHPKQGASSNTDTRMIGKIEVIATRITENPPPLEPPTHVSVPTAVSDHRVILPDGLPMEYVTFDVVHITNSVKFQELLAESVMMRDPTRLNGEKRSPQKPKR
jgi:hypothetical protein